MNKNKPQIKKTKRTTLNRFPNRGQYDTDTIYSILDSALICHIAYVYKDEPRIIPTAFARIENDLFIHGSRVAGNIKALASGIMASISITRLDGLVLARSGFNHSMNYRSVIIHGTGTKVENNEEKFSILNVFIDHLIPGRSDDGLKPISEQDLIDTTVIRYPLNEMSAKIRTGHPNDEDEDYNLPVWAGVIPILRQFGEPITDPKMRHSTPAPDYVKNYHK
ncbi:MAG: flavin-nucleotide-binding protein [Dehalococcoidia bacterium]|nr:flavin-nucleotide-binding protein [Dehalococcoidia bacterium]MQG15334.1 pyridoxamine 5'-phosphate oxidase family protein [SAR202 cluster bacterium]|tara:strand:- start:13421 stop:14086 length:666 start_codon:yes stop_codon:yes gene_type:complete